MKKRDDPSAELSDERRDALYDEAKRLSAIGSIGAYERAVSLLSQIPGWKNSDQIATVCLQKIMTLQAQARVRRSRRIKRYWFPLLAFLLFAFLMVEFVFPKIRYASSATPSELSSSAADTGLFSGVDGYKNDPDADKNSSPGKSGGAASEPSGERTAMASGTLDTSDYDPAAASASSHPDNTLSDSVDALHRSESITVSGGSGEGGGSSAPSGSSGSSLPSDSQSGSPSGESSGDGSAPVGETGGGDGGSTAGSASASSGTAKEERRKDFSSDNVHSSSLDAKSSGGSAVKPSSVSKEESSPRRLMSDAVFTVTALVVVLLAVLLYKKLLRPAIQYRRATQKIRSGNYPEALQLFNALNGWHDSSRKVAFCEGAIKDADYSAAIRLKDSGKLEDAITALNQLDDYKDSKKHIAECREAIKDAEYADAVSLFEAGKYQEAMESFKAFDGYRNSRKMISECRIAIEYEPIYRKAVSLAEEGNGKKAEQLFLSLHGFKDSGEHIERIRDAAYEHAAALKQSGDYSAAIAEFEALGSHRDCAYQIEACKNAVLEQKFLSASELKNDGRYEDAIDILKTLGNFPGAGEQITACKALIQVPRPFDRLYIGQDLESITLSYGSPSAETEVSENSREYSFENAAFLDSVGTLTVLMENGALKSASWRADFFWKTQTVKNRGKTAEKQYDKFVRYYTFLFGPRVSEYTSSNHKGSWWKTPSVTVDYGTNDYITIHCLS